MKNLSPKQRADVVRRSFECKVSYMEALVATGARTEQWWPNSLKELREWEDIENGILAWSSKSVDKPSGKFRELRLRYDRASQQLRVNSTKARHDSLKARNQVMQRQIVALAEQNARLLIEKQEADERLARSLSKRTSKL